MITVLPFAGHPVAVFGLGRSGLAAAQSLVQSEAEVSAWDDSAESRARARDAGIPLVDLYRCDWRRQRSLVLSPGIPLHHPAPHPVVLKARAAGCEVIGDIELLGRAMRECTFVGITGTNGKSTTTALIGHILRLAGRPIQVGGNIGVPVLALDPLESGGAYVLEMSSYQLELTLSIAFDVAVLLNISTDHLDRHGDMNGYIAAKRTIFHRQKDSKTAVVGVDDAASRDIFESLKRSGAQRVIPISSAGRVPGGVYADGGILYDDTEGKAARVMDLRDVATLPGVHNWQNAAAAYAATRAAGVEPRVIAASTESFPGLAHRQERIGTVDGVVFVNDSKATNGDAAAKALACYRDVFWIAGGRAKADGLTAVEPYFDRIRHVFLIGEAAPEFARTLEGRVPYTLSGDLKAAVHAAHAMARTARGDKPLVLLSPACASFDQFKNFEVRGEAFRALVKALPEGGR